MNKKEFLGIAFIILLTILLYGKIITYDFINWDDDIHVYNNPAFGSVTPIRDIWTTFKTTSYLPITHSLLYLQWRFSHSPHLFHTTNIILHLLNLLLIFTLLKKLNIGAVPIFFMTLIYAIHPMRVETVAWISDQKGLIAGIFIWSALICYIVYTKKYNISFLLLTSILYAVALLSKQTAFPLLFVFILYKYLILEEKRLRKYLPELLLLGAIGIGIMIIHWVKESKHFINTAAFFTPLHIRFLISSKSSIYYILKSILPIDLCPIYPRYNLLKDFVGDYMPPATVFLLTLWLFYYYKKNKNPFSKLLIFSYLSYTVTIFPVTGLFTMPYMNITFIADRYSYFSGLFITIIIVLLVKNVLKKYAYPILTIFGITCILSTYHYIPIWKEPVIFWTYIIKKNPNEDTSYTNLSYYYIHKEKGNKQNLMQAMSLAQKAIILAPKNPIGYYNYGVCLMKLGRLKEAEEYFRKSIEIRPDYSDVWNDLGYVFELQGQIKNAIECYNKTLLYSPDHRVARYNLKRLKNSKP